MKNINDNINFSILHNAISQARHNALKRINIELVNLYWQVGAFVSKQLSKSKWGDKTVSELSDFLHDQDPNLKGFDRKSIYRMVQFYESYYNVELVVPVDRQLEKSKNKLVVPLEPQLENIEIIDEAKAIWEEINSENIKETILAISLSDTSPSALTRVATIDKYAIFSFSE